MNRAICCVTGIYIRTLVTNIARTFLIQRDNWIKIVRNTISSPFFRPEEKRLLPVFVVKPRNDHGAANGKTEIVLFVRGYNTFLIETRRIEHVIADKVIRIAVKSAGTGLGFHFNRSGTVLAILRAV